MRMADMPIAVIMQRRAVQLPWAEDAWAAVAALPDRDRGGPPGRDRHRRPSGDCSTPVS